MHSNGDLELNFTIATLLWSPFLCAPSFSSWYILQAKILEMEFQLFYKHSTINFSALCFLTHISNS